MKIVLFKNMGNVGVITGWKKLIDKDYLHFTSDQAGELIIGTHAYKITSENVFVPQTRLILGEVYSIKFKSDDGEIYSCGTIRRTGSRLMEINNDPEQLIVSACAALDRQGTEIQSLKDRIHTIEEKYGISII